MKSTSPSWREDRIAARSPACWMAGPEVRRREPSLSAAMIIARVVFPSPGGPESSTWSGAARRCRAASRTSESWLRRVAWPTNSASTRGRSAASAARSMSLTAASVTRSSSTGAAQALQGGTQRGGAILPGCAHGVDGGSRVP